MKLAYCGFDFFSACLSTALKHEHQVIKVFTNVADNKLIYTDYIQNICHENQIPLTTEAITPEHLDELQDQGCELLISAAYSHKIPALEKYDIKGINIHPSLLPQGKGPWPIPWIILKNLATTGISIHQLTQEIDSGPILLQQKFALDSYENLESLNTKFQLQAAKALDELLSNFPHYWQHAKPQTDAGEYWPLPRETEFTLDWKQPADLLNRQIRAFGKHGCRGYFNQQWWWVFELTAWQQHHDYRVGDIVHLSNTETILACADGLVCLRYFRPQ